MNSTFRADSGALNGGSWRIDDEFPLPVVPAILEDELGQEEVGGLLPRTALERDLQVTIPAWPFTPNFPNVVVLSWRVAGAPFVEVDRFTFQPPIAPGDKTVQVRQALLMEGTYELSYKISVVNNPSPESLKKVVTVDLSPPGAGQKPLPVVFPSELAGVISDEYLTSEGAVECSVPSYFGAKAKDVAIWFWSDTNPPPDGEIDQGEVIFSQDEIDDGLLFISVPEQVIRASGQGSRYVYYLLRDLAGNISARSELSPITVDLTPPPENLQPVRVPLSTRCLIDRQHAREGATNEGGVTVEIDQYDNAAPEHRVIINWDGTELAEVPVDPSGFPLRAFVPWTVLTARGLGPLSVQVDYEVRRGTLVTPSPGPVSVPVDFTLAGQDHANAPALLNVTLEKPEVRGQNSDTSNTLTGADVGLDATATLALYQNPHPGERLALFWGSAAAPVAEYTVKAGDLVGQSIAFVIPWSAIEPELINPALGLFYVTDNGVNQQLSRTTDVNVNIEVIEDLLEPSFPHADIYGYLNCCAVPRLWEGVTVRVPGDARFAAGDRIELSWQGCKNLNGTDPITGVTATFSRTLSAVDASNGYDQIVLPFETLIAPMEDNGSATAQYTLHKASGTVGRSYMDFVKITRLMPDGKLCGPGNDLCAETSQSQAEGPVVETIWARMINAAVRRFRK
ncbi:hypothetical protein [Pseudomonas huanghezhanensis]|uniref:hypothetical protein n=1 Tax=Pseudomonas huanghezhanensis TaxID=3002903 RepID=UPI002285CEE2|nr:hypothetical protein [Pseudomonas sp. BSw22131]